MDYAIYKTTDGKNPRVIHRFTQEACNHKGTKDDFQYDYMTSVNTSECIRFYIDKL